MHLDKILGIVMIVLSLSAVVLALQPAVAYPNAAPEQVSPADRVGWDQLQIFSDRFVVRMQNVSALAIADTNSMDPLIDEDSIVLEVTPQSPEDLKVGDVISYHSDKIIIIHRIVETGSDEQGWYAVTKGDNNDASDGKVRWEQVRKVMIGILY